MFILYAVLIGLAIGLLSGGRPAGLAALHFRFGWLAVVGFAIQVVLFSGPVSDRIGALGAPIYVASTALVFVVLLLNARITRPADRRPRGRLQPGRDRGQRWLHAGVGRVPGRGRQAAARRPTRTAPS